MGVENELFWDSLKRNLRRWDIGVVPSFPAEQQKVLAVFKGNQRELLLRASFCWGRFLVGHNPCCLL